MRRRSWLSHISSGVLALLLAVIMWFVSSEDRAPVADRARFPSEGGLTIEFRHPPDGWAVYDPSQRDVRVGLRGLPARLATLNAGDVRAFVDLRGVRTEEITQTVDIRIACDGCRRRGVRVTAQDATTMTLRLGPLERETRSVTVTFDDRVPERYWITASPATPPQVQLSGARAQVLTVERVVAEVAELPDLSTEAKLRGVRVVPLDRAGRPVRDVVAAPPQVDVSFEVRGRGTEASVRPDVRGAEASGYYITGISVDPQFVQLEGPPTALTAIGQEGTVRATLDIKGATEDVVKRVPLALPDEVTALNAPDGVTVTVRIAPLHGSVALDTPVQTRGLGSGLVIKSVSPRRVDVLVGGPQATLGDLTADDVEVVLDLSGLGPGRHTVTPRPSVPSGYLWRSVSPSIVDVVIEAAGREVPTPPRP